MRVLFAGFMISIWAVGIATSALAQAKSDCSKYTGVEKEACEKMAGKKR